MRACIVGFFLIGCVVGRAEAQIYEVFPIRTGLVVRYDYWASARFYEVGMLFASSTDSGTVTYSIKDSTFLSDTLTIWQIDEISHLWTNSNSHLPYHWLDTTVSISLFEYTTGHHRLVAEGRIWKFPHHMGATQVNRYADVPEIQIGSGDNVARFVHDSGYVSYFSHTYSIDGTHSVSYFDGAIVLREMTPLTSVSVDEIPNRAELLQNYPNPFNAETIISFTMNQPAQVSIVVVDILGRRVRDVLQEEVEPGDHTARFDASGLPTGVYYIRLQTQGSVGIRKMLLIR